MIDPLSIAAAAREAPLAPALVAEGRTIGFDDLARLALARSAEWPAPPPGSPRPVVATATLDTVVTLLALLERREGALLIHPRLTPAERDALLADARTRGPLPGEAPAFAVFTSGTAGRPRAAVLSRAALVASARASEANLGWRPDDRWLLCMPLAHVGGLSVLTRCLAARRTVVLHPRFDAAAFPGWVEREAVTLASVVPTMLARVLDANPRWRPPATLRAVLVGGAAAPPRLVRRALDAGFPLLLSYGLTEACSQATTTAYASRFDPSGEGSGRPLPGVELAIDRERILVRGATMMTGYWGEPPLARGEWFDTGDRGRLDGEGRLHVLGRSGDLLVTGGENVDPAAVEAALEDCPGIAAAGVFGVPDETWGETVAAALVADGGRPSPAAVAAFVVGRLAPHRRPRAVCWLERLPETPGGKLDRAALAALADRLEPLPPAS